MSRSLAHTTARKAGRKAGTGPSIRPAPAKISAVTRGTIAAASRGARLTRTAGAGLGVELTFITPPESAARHPI
ncbi:hypothetical protein Psi01_42910 [Planobispora siamensis]|uniref:Uncharacterized protein n=1 Tax=Planobispora siamensis TaxID=936338 RepID=A0A8J3WNA3_9ACTN|nr:hypothetical protein Psi01_42910 [Planobispora siamensis]